MGRRVVEDQHVIDILEPLTELGADGRVRADLPGEAYDIFQYSVVVYGRAALFVDAVRTLVGPEAFADAMQGYVDTHRHGMANGVDLMEALRGAAEDPAAVDALYLRYIAGEGFP